MMQRGAAGIAVLLPGVTGARDPFVPDLGDVLGTGLLFVADPPGYGVSERDHLRREISTFQYDMKMSRGSHPTETYLIFS